MSVAEAPQVTEDHVRRLRGSQALYAENLLKIRTKAGVLAPFELNDAQRIVDLVVERQLARTGRVRALVLKARQEGISTYVAGRIYRGATLWPYRQGLVLADKLERAGEIFGIYERFNAHCGLKPPKRSAVKTRELSWTTDSKVTVDTAGDAQVARGTTIQYLHASEIAFWPNAEEAWTSLAQALPHDGGEAYIESTANGVGGLFYTMWLQAEAGENGWLAIFLPWWIHGEYATEPDEATRADIVASIDPFERMAQDVGFRLTGALGEALEAGAISLETDEEGNYRLTPAQLLWRRNKIRDDFLGDERTFRQEFPATAEEAFLVSGNAFFDEEALQVYSRRVTKPLARGNLVRVGGGIVFRPAEGGYLKIWQYPDPTKHYVIAADTASGRMGKGVQSKVLNEADRERGGRDYSVAEVLEISTMTQVAEYHGYIAPDIFAEGCFNLGYYYGCGEGTRRPALLAPENNHESGQTVIHWLLNHHYPRLYVHTRYNRRRERPSEMMGWVTDRSTRMPMLDDLAALVRAYEITLPSQDLIREMTTFVRTDEGRPEAQEGAHDDRVIALAIALQMIEHHTHGAAGKVPDVIIEDSPTGW